MNALKGNAWREWLGLIISSDSFQQQQKEEIKLTLKMWIVECYCGKKQLEGLSDGLHDGLPRDVGGTRR